MTQRPVNLPEGHDWKEMESVSSSVTAFECARCLATFTHDLLDDTQVLEAGDGSCDEEEEAVV